jgi:hypothetical protein
MFQKKPTYTICFKEGKRIFSYKKNPDVKYFYDRKNNQYHPLPDSWDKVGKLFWDGFDENFKKWV